MKRVLGLSTILIFLFLLDACSLAPFGGLYTNMVSPGALGHTTTYQVTPESDYESLAFVEGISKGSVILGLIAAGNFGYGAAIEDALSKAPGATRLVDLTVDTQIVSILGLYVEYITKVRGRAIRLKKK